MSQGAYMQVVAGGPQRLRATDAKPLPEEDAVDLPPVAIGVEVGSGR
jgi:hypothetical protein